jgi:hypothetical protein
MKCTLRTLFGALIATAMAIPAQAQPPALSCDVVQDDATVTFGGNEYYFEFCGSEYDDQNDQTTFLYRVTEIDGQNLSHWVLSLCEEALAAFVSGSPTDGLETGTDGSTGAVGVKWNTADGFSSGEFSFILDGFFGEDPDVVVLAKAGNDNNTSTITGPSCEEPLCTTETIPSWDGDVNFQPAMAFIDVNAPNGFKSISLLPGSENIVLVDVVGEDVAGSDPMSSNYFVNAFGTLTFDGDTPPTSLTVKFGPQTQDGSTFMFEVTDQYDCTLQVDPQITMTLPKTVELNGNYPNPFNPSTNIEFSLPEAMDVRLDVYDSMGRRVKSLVNDNLDAGVHNVTWNGTNAAGRDVASGVYFYRVQTGAVVQTKQMILLK